MPCWGMARKREIAALEARRFAAARLFARGAAQAVVVARFGVSRQTAHHWYQTWKQDGREGLTAAGRLGRRPRLDHQQLARVDTALREDRVRTGSGRTCGPCRGSPRSSSGSRGSGITRGMCGTCSGG